MIKKIISTLSIIALLNTLPCFQAYADNKPVLNATDLFTIQNYGDNFTLSRSNIINLKKGEKYDETKDPALRKGTENWEQPQSSFLAIPAAVIGLIALFLFFNRDK